MLYTINSQTLEGIADAIREKTEDFSLIDVPEMPAKIRSISGGSMPSEMLVGSLNSLNYNANTTFNFKFPAPLSKIIVSYTADNIQGGFRIYDSNNNEVFAFISGTKTDQVVDLSSSDVRQISFRRNPDSSMYSYSGTIAKLEMYLDTSKFQAN